ncbi:segregation/condensation protein A [Synechocystis sp. LKSZ1]|uniref:segregation/condensation protein A n=1 Tax=Synechocystis sp. LKSZ1 TaxID=3144951 RepID=UPI00336C0B3F
MTTTAASEAIATLITLAEQGEIDPWDVSVIDVIDRFLGEVGILQSRDLAYQQQQLPKSGQAFLWASMLVRYKADTLERLEQSDTEEAEVPEAIEPEAFPSTLPVALERHLRRRTAAPPLQRRRVTLAELIQQIQQIAQEIENDRPPQRLKRARPQSRREALQIITELAHQENLTELAAQLDHFLQTQWASPLTGEDWIDLDTLLHHWHQAQAMPNPSPQQDRVGVFWALLLLSSQSKVALAQEEFYQDLKVQVLVKD